MEVHCPHLPLIVHLGNGALGYCLRDGHLLVAELILGIAALEVDQVEAIVVAPSHYRVALRRAPHLELVEDSLVLDHLAQLRLQPLVQDHRVHRLLRVRYVPDLHREVVSTHDVLSVLGELCRGDVGNQINQVVLRA